MEIEIKNFLNGGSGDGSGDGEGYGSGNGSGNGSGDGEGYGDGDGYGSGDGEGYGYVDGDGSGAGDGSGIISVNRQKVYMIDDTPTLIDSVHGNYAKGSILNSDLTITPCYIAKVWNFFAHGDNLRNAFAAATEKYEQNLPMEERIARFNAQYPDREKQIPAKELFEWHNKLTGSCLMGRQQWCSDHNIDFDGEYTVNEFIRLTRNAYGGDVIRQLEETKP